MDTTGIIITSYNHLELLEKALLAVHIQSVQPDEIIITDDGSQVDVLALLKKLQPYFRCPLKFVRQENKGFRAAKIRNNAIRISEADYLIFLDQDIVISPGYVEAHIKNRRRNRYLVGWPIRLNADESALFDKQMIISGQYPKLLSPTHKRKHLYQYLKEKYYFFESYLLGKHGYKPKLRAGIFGIYKKDILKVDGFDENFQFGGGEDDDLGRRLRRAGIRGQNVFLREFAIHLFHLPTRKEKQDYTKQLAQKSKEGKYTRAINGISNPLEREPLQIEILS